MTNLDNYKTATPPTDDDFTNEDLHLINVKNLVEKSKKKHEDYYNGIMEPSKNRFLFQTKEDAIEKCEFLGEVLVRLEAYYENKMLSEYGSNWIFVAPFESTI